MPPNRPQKSEDGVRIHGRSAYAQAAAELAQAARREISLLSFELPGALYGTPAFCDAAKHLILGNPCARLRVLLHDPGPAARGHRLVDLGRQLSSFCEFRQLAEKDRELRSDWLIIDARHALTRFAPESLEASCHRDAPAAARNLLRRYDDYWESAQPASRLRSLHL